MDFLLAGTLFSLFMEFQCRVIVQRGYLLRRLTCGKHPLQAERHSGRRQKLFAIPPESRSPSDRNAVRNHYGMVFSFRRNRVHLRPDSPLTTGSLRSNKQRGRDKAEQAATLFTLHLALCQTSHLIQRSSLRFYPEEKASKKGKRRRPGSTSICARSFLLRPFCR
jgi:hypothetical protein